MSLNKQMILFITSMVIVLLLGTFTLNLNNTKQFLQEQLQSHAQDTATSLGLSLSSIENPEDISSMETMINAVFDRGYYSHINLIDMENNILYQRENAKSMDDVPDWFINAIEFHTPEAQALVQAGWIPVGTINVASHAGYAYIELWKAATNLLAWFSLAALIAILIAIYTLQIMLKPLKDMEKQAEAIVKKEYLIQQHLPSTIEFRQVVSAMNGMVTKLKSVFERDANTAEKLQRMAYQDSVTQLSNRRHFEMIIDSLLDPNDDVPAGVICLIRVNQLKELNDQFGYLAGDKLMKSLADEMKTRLHHENSIFARLNGTELVAVLPGLVAHQIEESAKTICQSMPNILKTIQADDASTSISLAYTSYQPGQSRGPIMGNLDFAIEQAEKQGSNTFFYYNTNLDQSNLDSSWEQSLTQAIKDKRFLLFHQSAYDTELKVHDQELFIRLKDTDGTIRSAAYFMPTVEQFHKTAEIDLLVINLAIQHLKTHPDTALLSINLSKAILDNEQFHKTLIQTLADNAKLTSRIAFELPERLVIEQKPKAWPLIHNLRKLGINIGIDHFGTRLGNMRYLQDLRPDYIKLDAAFTKAIENDEQTRNYVSSLCELADGLDIDVIAMTVENETQLKAFNELGVRYSQGYLFGAPAALN
ncbi:GGDEF domain-containing protein [Thiomicrorhabdus immobilis]|uniref:GGDEF domain-containing protein n=1 Tax=Thiomicrorhabdus immobilis TaxID=2791037 RepID=A0ABM7MB03_9GAMM|nr:EAL domain-containing protein [Thiomicrorhabdus immobilis]BCN92468.1 GGDEF domain-containing protein [Thiomicrorhabdus immobilis]